MSKIHKIIISVVVALIVWLGLSSLFPTAPFASPVIVTSSGVWYRTGNMLKTNPPLPLTVGRQYSTTTNQAVVSLLASELNGYSVVRVYASTSAVTMTLPASSTLATFIPNAGDNTEVLFKNASTTAGIDLGLLAGTGLTLRKATTTATTTASQYILTKFIRKSPTATNGTCPTNCDIDVYVDVTL